MRFVSTRAPAGPSTWSFQEALFAGMPPDGGLFVPVRLDPLPSATLRSLRGRSLTETATTTAAHLLSDELGDSLVETAVREALSFPIPLVQIGEGDRYLLELFHGPTLAFKDVGARFMARLVSALAGSDGRTRTILVATSGDTGGAVANAFQGLRDVGVAVLFPMGRVSPRQEAQFTTLGGNVVAVGVEGAFDDCQRLVKAAFADEALRHRLALTSANSINVGRLIPQIFYYVHAWASLPSPAPEPVVSVPSGNFGNLTAGLMARSLGVPIRRLVAATNANRTVPDYLHTGQYEPRPSVRTISNAMDVGNPSNFERILHHFAGDLSRMRKAIAGSFWTDDQTREQMALTFRSTGKVVDPHTAVALLGLDAEMSGHPGHVGVALATAHPAKFAEVVEPVIGEPLRTPPALEAVSKGTPRVVEVPPESGALRKVLVDAFG